MKGGRVTALATAAAILAAIVAWRGAHDGPPAIHVQIEPAGAAVFHAVRGDRRQHGWTVSCTAPLRGCVARTFGAVLRLDDVGRSWLAVAVPPQARLMIRHGTSLQDASGLALRPLDADTLRLLSQADTRLLVAEATVPDLVLQTAGLAEVADYLAWLQSPLARGLRDARLWPAGGPLDLQGADAAVLERYRLLRLRAAQSQDGRETARESG